MGERGGESMAEKLDLMRLFDYDPNFQNLMKRLLENAMEHSFHGIMITKAEPGYPIVYVNDAFTQITGYGSDELIGKSPAILQGAKTDRAELDRLDQALAEGRLFHGEAINYRKDGSEFIMEWKIVPVKNDKEVTSHYLALQRDVTKLANNPPRGES
jgi:PAS domain S-box-containing protein